MRRRLVAAALAALLLGASGCARRIPLPEHLRVGGVAELKARMQAAAAPELQSYSAEIRLTYFGPRERVRTTGVIAAARPASLRYEVLGPHGGVVSALATNGLEMQALDVPSSRFVYGRATPENLDRLLPFAPLGLGPGAWVELLFGGVDPPVDAALAYDERLGRFVVSWREGDGERRIDVDPVTARVDRAQTLAGGELVSEVRIQAREQHGLPTSFEIRMPAENMELGAKLRDIELNPELEPSVFVLEPPSGVVPAYLGESSRPRS